MSYEIRSAPWTAGPFIAADIDLEDPKRARNRAAQRKYRRKLQTKQDSARELQDESPQTHVGACNPNSWNQDTDTLFPTDPALYIPSETFVPELQSPGLDLYSQSSYDAGSLPWDGYSKYPTNSSGYSSIGPLTPVSAASPSDGASNLSPLVSYRQPDQYPRSPPYSCFDETLNQLDGTLAQNRDSVTPSFVSQQQHERLSLSTDLSGIPRASGESDREIGRPRVSGARILTPEQFMSEAHTRRRGESMPQIPIDPLMLPNTHYEDSYQDIARKKQRTHLQRKAENVVDNFSQLYDLGVGLDLCARDPEFKRTLQTTKRRFNELLYVDGTMDNDSDFE